ncbi:MAG: DMT family transporter, partial [Pseudomonadota bacterium]|nr:DMT family transporter [Pseudomonadota bacterium]
FGFGEACVKTLAAEYDILQVVWARYVFHALVFLAIFSRSGIISQMKTSRPFLHIARSITLMIGTVSFFTALIYLSLPEAVAINFVAPLLVTALSIPFLGEKVGPRRWAAIFVGFLGVLVIIRPGLGVMHWAAFLPLITAISYAGYQIMTRIAGRTEDTKTSLFWTSTVGVIVMSCIVPFVWKAPDATAWVIMVATGAVFGFGHYLLIRAFEVAAVSTLSPFLYTQIIWVTIISIVVFDQFPDQFSILGAAIVIGSGLYIWHRETRERNAT